MDRSSRGRMRHRQILIPGLIVLALVIGVYLLINLVITEHVRHFAGTYVLQPLLWAGLVLATLLASEKGQWGRIKLTRSFLVLCLLLGALQVVVLLVVNLFTMKSFGRSPYSHEIGYLFINTVFFMSSIVGLEFSRAFLLRTFSRYGATLVMVATALLYTFLMTPLIRFTHMTDSFIFFSGTFLPLLAQNVLASLLALLGGPLASIAFWGIMAAFEWYSPILPDTTWIVKSFIITLASVVGLLIVQSLYSYEFEPEKRKTARPEEEKPPKKRSSPLGWVLVAIVCVVIIFFSFGALGFRPLLVGSGSMRPALDVGDIAFVRTISPGAVKEGDIIQFRDSTGAMVVHRVIEIRGDGETLSFITRGDVSDSPDPHPIPAENVEGKVWFRIPKLGWISIGMKNLLS